MSQASVPLQDPSLADGGEVVFDKEIPLNIRESDDPNAEETRIVRFKIVLIKDEDDGPREVNIEIFCDNDMFMFYSSKYTPDQFDQVKNNQGLTIEFAQFADMVIESLVQNVEKPEEYQMCFTETSETAGLLEFQQKLKFKSVQIFALEFEAVSDEYLKEQIQYRFDVARQGLKEARQELGSVYSMLKIKNPNVIKQMRTLK